MTTTAIMMYWKPDKRNTLLFSMLGRFAAPVRVELRGINLEYKHNPGMRILPFKPRKGVSAGRGAHHSWDMVVKRAASWPTMIMMVWREMLPSTGRASRLAGGLQGCSSRLGPPRPITMAIDVIRQMSRNRNCQSPKFDPTYTHGHARARAHAKKDG